MKFSLPKQAFMLKYKIYVEFAVYVITELTERVQNIFERVERMDGCPPYVMQ